MATGTPSPAGPLIPEAGPQPRTLPPQRRLPQGAQSCRPRSGHPLASEALAAPVIGPVSWPDPIALPRALQVTSGQRSRLHPVLLPHQVPQRQNGDDEGMGITDWN